MLSNSTLPGAEFFSWPQQFVKQFLKNGGRNLIFIPFAAVTFSFDEYEVKVKAVFEGMGYSLQSIHHQDDKINAIAKCDGIVIGGGNTFALLARLYDQHLVDAIKSKISAGTPYIGWSAGANLAGPTIMTTNDMPIVQPQSFNALGLVPFQINPHYHELKFQDQGGETRKERLEEFIAMNPNLKVVGLPEGMGIVKQLNQLSLVGNGIAKLYVFGQEIRELYSGEDISFLLQ